MSELTGGAIFLDGKFRTDKCPRSKKGRCTHYRRKLAPGYGFTGGYGLGSYTWCDKCRRFFDFVEDKE